MSLHVSSKYSTTKIKIKSMHATTNDSSTALFALHGHRFKLEYSDSIRIKQ
jgi:hypothetical protein